MAPTPERTTVKVTIEQLISDLRGNLVADPPTAEKPFRQIVEGQVGVTEFPRPFLSLRLFRSLMIATLSDDKIVEVKIGLKVVADLSVVDPHEQLLDFVSAVDDRFDQILATGLVEGTEGFDDRVWTFDYPSVTSGARVATAEAVQTCVVKVERLQNLVPRS